ncbi:MAG: sel1 repeat family protein [Gammaproteobacteria bacterium]|nr:sel1 repeat family protein [Gammaproteobacteria bacterium]
MATDMDLFIKADEAYEAENFEEAFKIFKMMAESGDHNAFSNLGIMYECGQGTEVNYQRALFWYKKAWRFNEDSAACSNLADFYRKQENVRAARYWWKKGIARDSGDDALECAKSYLVKLNKRNLEISKRLLLIATSSKCISEDDREEAQALLTSEVFNS